MGAKMGFSYFWGQEKTETHGPTDTVSADATCVRSFSKLKLINNYLRRKIGQVRFGNVAVVSIECEIAEWIYFDSVMDKMAWTYKNFVNH